MDHILDVMLHEHTPEHYACALHDYYKELLNAPYHGLTDEEILRGMPVGENIIDKGSKFLQLKQAERIHKDNINQLKQRFKEKSKNKSEKEIEQLRRNLERDIEIEKGIYATKIERIKNIRF